MLRAARRHFAAGEKPRDFKKGIPVTDKEPYAIAIKRAVIDGNLEATLDEHSWFIKRTAPNGTGKFTSKMIDEFADAISVNRSSIRLHYGREADNRPSLPLRCHVATPFSRPDHIDGESVRPDQVRKAFNSPFWPHVLVTLRSAKRVSISTLGVGRFCIGTRHPDRFRSNSAKAGSIDMRA